MRVLFVNEVLGLTRLHYYLMKEDNNEHKNYLIELLEAGYLENVSDIFHTKEDKMLMSSNDGYLEYEGNMYKFPSVWEEKCKKLRTEENGIRIIEKYNQRLKKTINLQYKSIKEEDYNRMIVVEWEDGSESVLFNE